MSGRLQRLVACVLAASVTEAAARTDTVDVKYRGPVDLRPFHCMAVSSSLVDQVCHDAANT